jgi:hypothetical protein
MNDFGCRYLGYAHACLPLPSYPREHQVRGLPARSRFSSLRLSLSPEPNKAPEPTTFAVTSRAILRFTEGRARIVRPIVARAAPAKVVAHL